MKLGNKSVAYAEQRGHTMRNTTVAYMEDIIEKQIELKAPVERVWRALTDHQEFGEWFGAKMDGPFVVGRVVRGQITFPGYEHIKFATTVTKMEPPSLFSYTWHPYPIDPKVDYSEETPTLVEFRLEPGAGGGTILHVKESGFSKIPEYRRAEAFRKNTDGWAAQLENIQEHVDPKT